MYHVFVERSRDVWVKADETITRLHVASNFANFDKKAADVAILIEGVFGNEAIAESGGTNQANCKY